MYVKYECLRDIRCFVYFSHSAKSRTASEEGTALGERLGEVDSINYSCSKFELE